MESVQLSIALLTAGVALFAGLVSLFIGLHKDGEKTDLFFGLLCIAIFLFFIVPPVGFILTDKAPFSFEIIFKRFFNFFFFSIFPWFVFYYTGYKKKLLPYTILILTPLVYLLMILQKRDINAPVWAYIALVVILLSVVHGFIAVRYQFKNGTKRNAKWFQFALFVYLILLTCSVVFQLNVEYFVARFHRRIFFPINLFPLSFILIMGLRLRTNFIEKYRLERLLNLKNVQWESLMQNLQLVVAHTDKNGILSYINPYGVKLLHYNNSSELIGRNWFDYFLPGGEWGDVKEIFQKVALQGKATPHYKNIIVTKDGDEKIINWTTELAYDNDGKIAGLISFGTDISEQETAFQQIRDLKSELEKENLMLKGEVLPEWMQEEIIGKSEAITYAIHKAKKVSTTHATVLLEGETGVGKELFADLIQRSSLRNMKPFVKLNCGALPAELIEDELFGHEKGAFTGAVQARKGRFEIADGGTIFLDEIGELPLSLQPKLLRVLQNGEFERVGGHQTIKVDVRIIAATNRELGAEVKEGRFRDDLYYRLNVFPITIPALRFRKEDIPMLVEFFIEKESHKHSKSFKNINKSDLNHLSEYDWPGNIREMRNVIERAVINSDTATLRLDLFYNSIKDKVRHNSPASLEELEKEHIIKVLQESRWRISGEGSASEKLVMNPSTLRSRMKKLNISRSGNEIV
ncbi:MAG TPA: sigma 54-interacting transcriptional regulator [Puia sp.]|nr:sigma 54-interacting transcriptional regulator [Puia sp.]